MKVVFRVDASLEMGAGHVMRCLTLAHALQENGCDIGFICRQHKGNLIEKIRTDGFDVYELPLPLLNTKFDDKLSHASWLGVTQQQDADECAEFLRPVKADWLVVDHYALDEEWQSQLSSYYRKIMVIDDLADRRHQCDILLDQTFGRKRDDYLAFVPPKCRLLLGSEYALLRPEFAKWRPYSLGRRKRSSFKKMLVSMGGMDIENFTTQALKSLEACKLPNNVEVTVVMGESSPHLHSVASLVKKLTYNAQVSVDVRNMAEVMANSDVAIGASGSTTWERCCLGLPTVQLITARNQMTVAAHLKHAEVIQLVQSVEELPIGLQNLLENINNFVTTSKDIIDGLGSGRVVNVLSNHT